MMKKYNKPEIVTLALDVIDVIETSGEQTSALYAAAKFEDAQVQEIGMRISNMSDTWNW